MKQPSTVKPFSYYTTFRYVDDEQLEIARAKVAFHQIGEQAPYFSITGEIYGRAAIRGEPKVSFDGNNWWMHACGCQHELLSETFPELAPLIKWHLTFADGPMHYIENAAFWMQVVEGVHEHPRPEDDAKLALTNFKSTVVFGALADDVLPNWTWASPNAPPREKKYAWDAYARSMRRTISESVSHWCEARLPALRDAFTRDLVAARDLEGKL